LRSGTIALRAALDAVKAGSAKNVIVAAADIRLAGANGLNEMFFGDGAGAVLVSSTKVAAEYIGGYTISEDFMDQWRSDKDTFVRAYEERFIERVGIRDSSGGSQRRAECLWFKAQDITKFTCNTDDPRHLMGASKILKFDTAQVQDTYFMSVGNAGTAVPLMTLVGALEESKAGDTILAAGHSDGCDALVFKVKPQIEKVRDRGGIKGHLASKRMVPNYQAYVLWRGLMYMEPQSRPGRPTDSLSALWRDRNWGLPYKAASAPTAELPSTRCRESVRYVRL